jgi:hypothetical protein
MRRSRTRDRHTKREHREKNFDEELKTYSDHRKKSKKHK